ncbi:NACHT, LRR and PYD domains-containing protein 3-like isoform X1 [Styela clava]
MKYIKSPGQRVKKFIKYFNKRTWKETEVKIAENYKKLNEPDFEVHPKLKKVPNFYEGQMAAEYKKEKGFAVTEGSEEIGQLITMNKLSEQLSDESCNYIAITGQAGSGKTTIMKRVSRSVVVANELVKKARKAKGTFSQLLRKKKRQFRFVHHFGFKDMPVSNATRPEEALSPCDLLFGKIAPGFKNLEVEEGYEWVIEHDYECIFFFDGLDQAMWDLQGNHNKMNYFDKSSTATIMYNILTRNLFPRAKIVISSREHKIASLPLELRPPFITALAGLDPEDIKKLFISVLGESGEESWNRLTVQSPSLIQFSSVPLFLLLNAIVHKFNPANPPDTMTDVMIQILHIFMRSDHAQERGNIKQNIRKLMKMSFEGTKEKRVIFTIDDLKKVGLHSDDVRDLIIKVPGNNMLSQHLMEGDNLMFFSHQILQEILASLYIANMDLATFQSFITEEIHDDHWSVVLRLLCGIIFNQDIKTEFLKDLTTVKDREAKKALLRESLKNKMSQCTRSYQKLELFGALYEANDAELIQSHVPEINFENESFNAAGMYAMSSVMRRCGHLEQFRLVKCDLNAELMKCLELNLKGSGVKVSKIDISDNQMNEEVFKSLGSALASIDGNEMELKLQMCELTKEKIDALRRNSGLKILTLDVRNNSNITSDLFVAIAKIATQSEVKNLLTDPCKKLHLATEQLMELSKWKSCGKIYTLDVRNNSEITSDLFLAIAKVATRSEVKNLLTDPCEVLHLTTDQLMELSKWKTCGKIHTLDVRNNSKITSDLFLAIAKVATRSEVENLLTDPCEELHLNSEQLMELGKWKTCGKLDKLVVNENKDLGTAGWSEVGLVVTQCQVKALEARYCNLTAEGMKAFKENTRNAKLDKLVVSHNSNLGTACWGEVGLVVTQCQVKVFKASYCNLTAGGLKAFKENTRNARLDKLVVSHNSNLGTACWGEVGLVVTQCQVKVFKASYCNLTAGGLKAFKENTRNARLDLLDVSGNKNLGNAGWGEVGLVVTQCQVMALEARYCNLTAEVIKAFKENTRNAKIEFLDLSGNQVSKFGNEGLFTISEIVLQCQVETLHMRICGFNEDLLKRFKALIADTGVEFASN